MILQAGDSEEGREFAAATADAIFTRHSTLEAGQAFYADVKCRLARYGRSPRRAEDPARRPRSCSATPTPRRQENADDIRRQQVSPQTAILLLEQLWNRDLSAYDPTARCPTIDPDARRRLDHPRAGARHAPRPAGDGRGVAGRWPRRSGSASAT